MAIDPRTLPDYVPGGFYDDNGNLIAYYGPYGGSGGSSEGMGTVGPPNSGGGAGSVGSGYGYTPPGAGLSPLNSGGFGDAGAGIYADASMYRGGDFQGGGSDPYAGTIYAGGEGSNYSGGGIGSDAARAPSQSWESNPSNPDYNPSRDAGPSWWPGNNYPDIRGMTPEQFYGGGYDMIPGASYGDYSSARDFTGGAGYSGGGGGGGGQSPSYSSGIPPDTTGGQGFSGNYNNPDYNPAFDYNVFNSPSFDGNWGDAAFAAQLARPESQYWQGEGWNSWFDTPAAKDQSRQGYSGIDVPSGRDWQPPSWLYGAGQNYNTPYDWSRDPNNPDRNPGGIGSDALRDSMAWTLAQSSPYAENANIPTRPTANQGYNPGMANWFANPDMQTYDPGSYQRQLEQILREIDQGTGNQNLDPNWFGPGATQEGGRSFYQGTGLQPTDLQRHWLQMNQGS